MTYSRNPNRENWGLASILAFLAVLTVLADFWEERPFTAWSEKEAHRILSDPSGGKIEHVSAG